MFDMILRLNREKEMFLWAFVDIYLLKSIRLKNKPRPRKTSFIEQNRPDKM